MICIVLQATDAVAVKGISKIDLHAELVPVALNDGTFVLPPEVIDAPEFAEHHDLLASLPQRDVAQTEFKNYRAAP